MIKALLDRLLPQRQSELQKADWPEGELVSGFIEPYWEQGMEGSFDYVFVPNENRESVNGGRGYFLHSGDYLRILGQDETVLWEGQLNFVPSRIRHLILPDRHNLKSSVWSYTKQGGVSYADWVGWFWAEPRLKAEFLKRPTS